MVAEIGYVPREAQQQPMHAARQRALSIRVAEVGPRGRTAHRQANVVQTCAQTHRLARIGRSEARSAGLWKKGQPQKNGEIMEECNTAEEAKRSREPTREGQ